jgi:hypothetical protein
MEIKLKTTARTAYSEQIIVLDTDTLDQNDEPVNIGKLDVHFVGEQIVGTLLIWEEFAEGFRRTHGPGSDVTMDELIDMILSEVSEPLGVPGEYGVEVFYPSVNNHVFTSNYAGEEEEGEEFPADTAAEYHAGGAGYDETVEEVEEEIGEPKQDDFARQLRERP